jgi:hypothetical protein
VVVIAVQDHHFGGGQLVDRLGARPLQEGELAPMLGELEQLCGRLGVDRDHPRLPAGRPLQQL